MRITIVGLPGSGKSTLAEAISKKLSIPHVHIDHFWFESGGRRGSSDTPNIEQVRTRVRERALATLRAPSWVSDGFYSHLQPEIASKADVVLFLDVSLWRRLLNHAKRTVFRGSRHLEVNIWSDFIFFYEIVRRTFIKGPKLKQFLTGYKEKLIILKSREEINQYVANLK